MNLVQGLGVAYMRNSTPPTLQQYIGNYLAVQVDIQKFIQSSLNWLQFNAVVDQATSGGNNIYGGYWTGPPSANFSGINQTTALGALIGAIGLESFPSLSPSPSPVSLSPTPSASGMKLGAVLGGVFGGLAIIIAALSGFLWRSRSRRRKVSSSALSAPQISPFDLGETSGMTLPGTTLPGERADTKRRDPTSHPPPIQSPRMEADATGQITPSYEETLPDYPFASSPLGTS